MPYNPDLVREPIRFEPSGFAISYGVLGWFSGIIASLVFAYTAF